MEPTKEYPVVIKCPECNTESAMTQRMAEQITYMEIKCHSCSTEYIAIDKIVV